MPRIRPPPPPPPPPPTDDYLSSDSFTIAQLTANDPSGSSFKGVTDSTGQLLINSMCAIRKHGATASWSAGMTGAEYRKILAELGLGIASKATAQAPGVRVRQIQYAAGKTIPETVPNLLRDYQLLKPLGTD